jgi:hypothetical protein
VDACLHARSFGCGDLRRSSHRSNTPFCRPLLSALSGHATTPAGHGWRVQSDYVPDDDAFAALSSRSRTALHVIDEEIPASAASCVVSAVFDNVSFLLAYAAWRRIRMDGYI